MIDLTPGRKSISQRYGVELPRQALGRILAERCGPEGAAAVLQELARAELRYQRAVRIEQARRRVQRHGPLEDAPQTRAEKAYQRCQNMLAHAVEYIEGTWKP